MAAKRTLCLHTQPILTTISVKVVLWIALKCDNAIIWSKCDKADGAVWHVRILLLIILEIHTFQSLNVPLNRNLPSFVCCIGDSSFNVTKLT